VLRLLALYLLAAIVTRVVEESGIVPNRYRCACEPECWCKQPGLSLFRWVTPPRFHRLVCGDG
jgi:hypothetical protein